MVIYTLYHIVKNDSGSKKCLKIPGSLVNNRKSGKILREKYAFYHYYNVIIVIFE